MKKCILIAVISIVQTVVSQENNPNFYYLSSEVNFGNYIGVDYGFNYVHQGKYSLKIGYSTNIRKAQSAPNDYSAGIDNIFEAAADHFSNYSLTVGKIYSLNQKGTIRANIAAGIGYAVLKEPTNWQPLGNSFVLTENYRYNYHQYGTMSFVVNPKIEFPLTKHFGLSASPMVQITKDRTFFGGGIGILLGKLK